jgi:hypothetical protein
MLFNLGFDIYILKIAFIMLIFSYLLLCKSIILSNLAVRKGIRAIFPRILLTI